MQRRQYLALTGALTTTVLAGCASDDDEGNSTGGDNTGDATDTPAETTTDSETTPTDTDEQTTTDGGSGGEGDLAVRVITEGAWSGSIGTGGSQRSVEGEGEDTLDVDDSADVVSATIQKDADDDSELTVQLLRGDTVVKESSTTSSHGVVSVSSLSNAEGENGDSSGEGSVTAQVAISYDGEWSGSISAGGSSRSVDGEGDETIDITEDASIISANAQKQDDSSDELVIQILVDGEVAEEASTSAEYGVASVTAQV